MCGDDHNEGSAKTYNAQNEPILSRHYVRSLHSSEYLPGCIIRWRAPPLFDGHYIYILSEYRYSYMLIQRAKSRWEDAPTQSSVYIYLPDHFAHSDLRASRKSLASSL